MKIIFSSDWHHGEKNNSIQHNQDLLDFIDFMIQWSIDNDVHEFAHLGDFFHARHKIDVHTKDYATESVNRLNKRFGSYVQLKGNHDLYLRDSREISSLNVYRDKVDLVENHVFDASTGILYISWIVNAEEYDHLVDMINENDDIKYVVGHFEFNGFTLNDRYIMEHGQSHKELRKVQRVFSGHYHGRQEKDNVIYIGSPFPFDYNDANDFNRGFCVLDTDTNEVEFINYEKISVVSMSYQDVLASDFSEISDCSLRVVITDDIDAETMDKLKEKLQSTDFRDTKIKYDLPKIDDVISADSTVIGDVTDIDTFVINYIRDMEDVDNVDKSLLESIFIDAKEQELSE